MAGGPWRARSGNDPQFRHDVPRADAVRTPTWSSPRRPCTTPHAIRAFRANRTMRAMIGIYCHDIHGEATALRGVRRAARLRDASARPLRVRRRQADLRQLQGPLLQRSDARAGARRDALRRPADAVAAPGAGDPAPPRRSPPRARPPQGEAARRPLRDGALTISPARSSGGVPPSAPARVPPRGQLTCRWPRPRSQRSAHRQQREQRLRRPTPRAGCGPASGPHRRAPIARGPAPTRAGPLQPAKPRAAATAFSGWISMRRPSASCPRCRG